LALRQAAFFLESYDIDGVVNALRHHPGRRHADPRMVHVVVVPTPTPDTDVPADFLAPDCRREMVIALHDVETAATVVSDAPDAGPWATSCTLARS